MIIGISTLSPIVQSTVPSTSSTAAAIMGSKRNRILIRQPRVKRDSDTLNPSLSPDTNPLEYELAVASGGHHFHSHHHGLLTVPPRIERHASEPAPSLTPSSPQLLTVPLVTGEHHHHSHGQPFLVKQHSHPLLPSQQSSSITSGPLLQAHGGSHSAGIVGYHQTHHHHSLHRQLSHPLSSTSVTLSAISVAPMTTITNPSLTQQLQQQQPSSTNSNSSSCSPCITSTYTQCGSSTSTLHYVSAATPSTSSSIQTASSSSSILNIKKEFDNLSSVPPITKAHSSSGVILLSEQTAGSGVTSPTLRVKSEELQRSVSSPQATIRELSLDNPRSSHCPVIRPGPALGCNFCWNTIDAHGRILRRKTKYHCPECQTNLCIVPCFQEYHERQSTDSNNPSNNKDNNKFSSSGLRHYPKTESI